MLLISAAYANFCQTCSSCRISLQPRATLRIPSALLFVALFSVVRLLVYAILGK